MNLIYNFLQSNKDSLIFYIIDNFDEYRYLFGKWCALGQSDCLNHLTVNICYHYYNSLLPSKITEELDFEVDAETYYVENAAAHPSMIGTHWFQWWDQPSTGRFDGENYNIGLVDVTDQPYKEFIEEAVKTHKIIYEIHKGEIEPFAQKALVQ